MAEITNCGHETKVPGGDHLDGRCQLVLEGDILVWWLRLKD
ncbi:hypothetical protein SLEP1_g56293 [Rubroshorea leprosula]|uniref:Uncharacterized protein n=1 Tax=Rubroshorea leprosula TaxID=152421 RepID=A0AAV5MHX7_9ROSI|nr:hypothetical protein SLEP1_g56293 [Rubroshorea leprosula]